MAKYPELKNVSRSQLFTQGFNPESILLTAIAIRRKKKEKGLIKPTPYEKFLVEYEKECAEVAKKCEEIDKQLKEKYRKERESQSNIE